MASLQDRSEYEEKPDGREVWLDHGTLQITQDDPFLESTKPDLSVFPRGFSEHDKQRSLITFVEIQVTQSSRLDLYE